MNKKIGLVLIVFIGILVILAPILYFMLQKTQEPKITGPNPVEEYQKFVNDKTITKIYSGIFPCNSCEGIEKVITLFQESDDATKGNFTYSETYLGSENDAFSQAGVWKLQNNDGNEIEIVILIFPDGNEKKYERIDEDKLVEIGENGKRLQENGKDLTLTLLN